MADHLPKRAKRRDVAELEAAIVRRDFHRLAPGDMVAFSDKLPLPPGAPRGPYTRPTRVILTDIEAGPRRILENAHEGTPTAPAVPDPGLWPMPAEGCDVCAALARQRRSAYEAGSSVAVQSRNEEIANHPHRRADRA